MPLYEYECDSCGHRFEVIQKFSDAPLLECTKCKGALRKLFSSPAIQFKGSGWYITDYAKKNSGAATTGKGEGSAETTSASEASSGSTSDAAPKTDGAAPKAPTTSSS
jgi:putative FmdB family regulatory protein